jgi:shikimate kinase
LWTDAFAVCNYIGLQAQTGNDKFRELALLLVDRVHGILGRHRDGEPRSGWISGLDEENGRLHPTRGGLRIGKEMPERGPHEPFDTDLEWDRDGQYFHYLTRWMHALNTVSRITGDARYWSWAVELAEAAHEGFVYLPPGGGRKRMHWKMSIDLSRPLVASMGHHDPLDGWITLCELLSTAPLETPELLMASLERKITDFEDMARAVEWTTEDPLGLGGLLEGAWKVARMTAQGKWDRPDILATLLDAALQGLKIFSRMRSWQLPPRLRLPFRELGLSIGFKAAVKLNALLEMEAEAFKDRGRLSERIDEIMAYTPMAESLEASWLEPSNRQAETWTEHREINMVMLATSLAPEGALAYWESAPPPRPTPSGVEKPPGGARRSAPFCPISDPAGRTPPPVPLRPNIVLIGMPGSGKSTVGVLLAKKAFMDFIDTDILIQCAEGKPLQEIVDTQGHMALRRIEEEVLLKLECRNHVVATGGSAVYSEAAMEHLKSGGRVVFLEADLATLQSRVHDYETRGLAKRPDQTLEELFQERSSLYSHYADTTIHCAGLTLEEVCSAILTGLEKGAEGRP